jgi:hypothetical protein
MSNIVFPAELVASRDLILNTTGNTNCWALYSYGKGGNELKLVETGGKFKI